MWYVVCVERYVKILIRIFSFALVMIDLLGSFGPFADLCGFGQVISVPFKPLHKQLLLP